MVDANQEKLKVLLIILVPIVRELCFNGIIRSSLTPALQSGPPETCLMPCVPVLWSQGGRSPVALPRPDGVLQDCTVLYTGPTGWH